MVKNDRHKFNFAVRLFPPSQTPITFYCGSYSLSDGHYKFTDVLMPYLDKLRVQSQYLQCVELINKLPFLIMTQSKGKRL